MAVDRDFPSKEGGEKETDFIDCVAWRNTGEFVAKHFPKGSMAVVSGRLQIRGWTDKDGNKRRTAEIVAENIYFAGSKKEPGADSQEGGLNKTNPWRADQNEQDFVPLDDQDGTLPF